MKNFAVSILTLLNVHRRAHALQSHAKDLAHGKPTGGDGGESAPCSAEGITNYQSQAVVDDVIFPHNIDHFTQYYTCGSQYRSASTSDSFLWIDLEASYSVRSIYLANIEEWSYEGLEIHVGNLKSTADPLCWKETTQYASSSRWIECDPPLKGRYIYLFSPLRTLRLFQLMVYEEKLVQMYAKPYQNNLLMPDTVTKNAFRLFKKVHHESESTCMTVTQSFELLWPAFFPVSAIFALSYPDSSGNYVNQGNKIYLYGGGYQGFARTVSSNPQVWQEFSWNDLSFGIHFLRNVIDATTMPASGKQTFCMFAVLAPCDCNTTKFNSDGGIYESQYQNTKLLVQSSQTLEFFIGGVTRSFKTVYLHDSISLVCSATKDHCGEREFVIFNESGELINPSPAWFTVINNSITDRWLLFIPTLVTQTSSYTIKARLKDYPNLAVPYFPVTAAVNFKCSIVASTIQNFEVVNLATEGLYGTFIPFTSACSLQYSVEIVSFDGTAGTPALSISVDLPSNKFKVSSQLINQVGNHSVRVKAVETGIPSVFSYSASFAVAVKPDQIATSSIIARKSYTTAVDSLTYQVGSGVLTYELQILPASSGSYTYRVTSIMSGLNPPWTNSLQSFSGCDESLYFCRFFDPVTFVAKIKTHKIGNVSGKFVISVWDSQGVQSATTREQSILLRNFCGIAAPTTAIASFTVVNLEPEAQYGTFQPFNLFPTTCVVSYEYELTALDGQPVATPITIKETSDLSKFTVSSQLIKQVGRYNVRVRAFQVSEPIIAFAFSNYFTVTVAPDQVASSLQVLFSSNDSPATSLTYSVGSGDKGFTFKIPYDTTNSWTPKLALLFSSGSPVNMWQNAFNNCNIEQTTCYLFQPNTPATNYFKLNTRRMRTTGALTFVISVQDSSGQVSATKKEQILKLYFQCDLAPRVIQDFTVPNLAAAALYGTFVPFVTTCQVDYTVSIVSFDGVAGVTPITLGLNQITNQFSVSSQLIRQIGNYRARVTGSVQYAEPAIVVTSQLFTITVEPDQIASSLSVLYVDRSVVASQLAYALNSGIKSYQFSIQPASSGSWTAMLALQTPLGVNLSSDLYGFNNCYAEINVCQYFDPVSQVFKINSNQLSGTLNLQFVISVQDSSGMISATKRNQMISVLPQCDVIASTIAGFSVQNLAPEDLYGNFVKFITTCPNLQYQVEIMSFSGDSNVENIAVSIDLLQFRVSSQLIKQVGKYRAQVVSIASDMAPDQVSSNVFTITVLPFEVGNVAVNDVASGSVAQSITYAVGSGVKTFQYELGSREKNSWIGHLLLRRTSDQEVVGSEVSVFDSCDQEKEACYYFDTRLSEIVIKSNRMNPTIDLQFGLTIEDQSGHLMTTEFVQSMKVQFTCEIKTITPLQPLKKYVYTMGSGPREFTLSNFKQDPNCLVPMVDFKYEVSQYKGTVVSTISIQGLVIQQEVKEELDGQTEEWAIISSAQGITSAESIIQITFNKQKEEVAGPSVQPPFLVSSIDDPPAIPCLSGEDKPEDWEFSFPMAVSETGTVKIKLECPSLKNLFTETKSNDILNLKLSVSDKKFQFGAHTCKLVLSDRIKQESHNTVQFWNKCGSFQGVSDEEKKQQKESQAKPVAPEVKQIKITPYGSVTLFWNTQMNITQPELAVKILPGSELTDVSNLNITNYTVGYSSETSLVIELNLKTPGLVSINQDSKDILLITFNNLTQLVSNQGLFAKTTQYRQVMPRQMSSGQTLPNVGGSVAAAQYTLAITIVLSHPATMYFASALLGIVEPLSIQMHLALLDLKYPANVRSFFQQFFPFITFDLVPTDMVYELMFQINSIQDEAFNEQFESVGYKKTLAIHNMQSIFVFIVLMPLVVIVLYFAKQNCCHKRIRDYAQKKWTDLVFNGIIDFYYQTYLVMSIIGWLSLENLRLGSDFTTSENFSSVFGIILVVFSCVFPVGLYIWLYFWISHRYHDGRNPVRAKYYIEWYCGLLKELRVIKRDERELKYLCFIPIIPLIFQFVLVMGVVRVSFAGLWIPILTQTALLSMSYIAYQNPYLDPSRKQLMFFNYIMLLMFCYLMKLFTDFVDITISDIAGNFFIYGTQISIFGNFVYYLYPGARRLWISIKKKYYLLRNRRIIQKRLAAKLQREQNTYNLPLAARKRLERQKRQKDNQIARQAELNANSIISTLPEPVVPNQNNIELAIVDELVSMESERSYIERGPNQPNSDSNTQEGVRYQFMNVPQTNIYLDKTNLLLNPDPQNRPIPNIRPSLSTSPLRNQDYMTCVDANQGDFGHKANLALKYKPQLNITQERSGLEDSD